MFVQVVPDGWFEWKITIHSKTFAVAVLYTYIANRQGHNSQEKIHGRVKNHEKFSPADIFLCMVYSSQISISSIKSKEVCFKASFKASSTRCTRHHIQKVHDIFFSTNLINLEATTLVDALSVLMPINRLQFSA